MGRHKEWRKVAKKERRRNIRQKEAKQRDSIPLGTYMDQQQSQEQDYLELLIYEQIEKSNIEENEKWMKAEKIALEQWEKLQKQKEILQQQHLEKEAKLKLEWEMEQERKKEEEKRLKELEEEQIRKQQLFMEKLEQFLSGDSRHPPPELLISRETKPHTENCPFFSKTACCRFGDNCSRNHQYPGISKVLLATNFFIHFGLDNANYNEYDTDLMLEYEDSDTYKQFKDFFYDVLPEFEKFGTIRQFRVCHNHEKHLRGNTYVEFTELRCAVAAYRSLHTRWYGGRQLSLQFCNIMSWKNAICGLQSRKKCPKGRACNFLHVFRNPNNAFNYYDNREETDRIRRTPRSWRWSESPEREIPRKKRSSSRERRPLDRRREDKYYSEHYKQHKHRSRRNSERREDRGHREEKDK